jgi:mono/diheme cytochrome c family protein
MKKVIVVFAITAFVVGCAKKGAPTASASGPSSIGNSGTVVSGGNAGASSGSSATATPSAENTGTKTPATPSTNAAPEVQGQATYNGKCGKCHGLKVVGDYTADRWASIMAVMGPKAHLNDAETSNVMAYVKANAKK